MLDYRAYKLLRLLTLPLWLVGAAIYSQRTN
jgi:hypothetical protein